VRNPLEPCDMAPRSQRNTGALKRAKQIDEEEEEETVTIITIPVSSQEDDDEEDVYNAVMNVEEFLAEHNIRVEENEENDDDIKYFPKSRPSIIVNPKREISSSNSQDKPSSLYKESKRAIEEREKEEKKRQLEEADFSAEDLSLATIPGLEFDPKQRSFEMDELRPQPIIKKRSKLFVKDVEKDDKYWEKREKNNNAARRSREARRLKENQIALRVAHLERENGNLKQILGSTQFDITKLTNERDLLKRKLSHFE